MRYKNEEVERGPQVAAPYNQAEAVRLIEEWVDRLLQTTTQDDDLDGVILSLSAWHVQALAAIIDKISHKVRTRDVVLTIQLQQFMKAQREGADDAE